MKKKKFQKLIRNSCQTESTDQQTVISENCDEMALKGLLAMAEMFADRKEELFTAQEEVNRTFHEHHLAIERLNKAYGRIHDVLWHFPFYAKEAVKKRNYKK
jgi:hypothetical protein